METMKSEKRRFKATKPEKFSASEHNEQVALFNWFQICHTDIAHLLMAIPNGGWRNKITGYRLKQEGVRPGVPDLFLAVPKSPYAGLWIEMKRKFGGRVTTYQQNMIHALRRAGYAAEVCQGWEAARDAIENYLNPKEAKNA